MGYWKNEKEINILSDCFDHFCYHTEKWKIYCKIRNSVMLNEDIIHMENCFNMVKYVLQKTSALFLTENKMENKIILLL